ncbi:YczE/YyaS/YitT family protein [Saccharothrix sp. ALI-22-I]|uniref:YczE/YyaS/YitT family protein n=1 Tax=Saccharothrix sp. ALI-22-I TaxID=1933778 RepID=UPI00097C8643|nr:hypothetical protein [Saccharothrix sp. ALI-22-I]
MIQMVVGTTLMGVGVGLVVRSQSGLLPLDVLHAAVADRAGFTLGGGIIAVQAVLLALWVPLRIRPGPATLLAAIMPGVGCDLTLAIVPTYGELPLRLAQLPAGGFAFALGVALYLGAHLGANPRDGIIEHLHLHGYDRARARIVLDLACLAGGLLLIGPAAAVRTGVVGAGSVLLALAVGPLVARLKPLFDHIPPTTATATPTVSASNGPASNGPGAIVDSAGTALATDTPVGK